jgi:predicted small integral membrane protein
MRRPLIAALLGAALAPAVAAAQTTGGWGNVGKPKEEAFSWTQPLFDGFWMAWTPASLAFFIFVFSAIAFMGVLEWRSPGGAPRRGILGLDTTRGDRLFISLLGSAFIFLGWLGVMGTPLWGALAIAIAWGGFVYWKV